MRTIELEVWNPVCPERPSWTEWVPEYEVDEVGLKIVEAGLRYRSLGEVSWQRQLAAMENPEL